jgi:transposase, IS5 family
MQRQGSFAEAEYAGKKRQTRRDKFLAEMERAVPWGRLVGRLALYPKGERGRPPIGLERMLRVYFVQQWYGLSDEGLEDALYDSQALRGFAGIDLNHDPVPDATTVLHFRHWLERHGLTKVLFDEVGAILEERGLLMRQSLPRRRPGARLSMPRSSPPRPRPKTSRRRAIRRCTRPEKAISGTSG